MNYIVKDGKAYCGISGQLFPVTSVLVHEELGAVPILDIPQMSDERWQELARERRAAGKGVPA